MRAVSTECLSSLLAALVCGLEQEMAFAHVDGNDSAGARNVIRALIRPYFNLATPASKENCKESLRYYLITAPPEVFAKAFEHMQECVIDIPDDPRAFFVLIWEELFGGESLTSRNIGDCVESPGAITGLRFRPPPLLGAGGERGHSQ